MRSPEETLDHEPVIAPGSAAAPEVEVVVPVRNEERDLGPSVRRLHAYLTDRFPFTARLTIADNGSTDGTWAAAVALAGELGLVRAIRLDEPGRGRALRSIWSASDACVLAYMDVDLSTDLNALLPLVAPLLSGHSDVAIGTRLGPGARVIRGPRREIISRCYNLLLHVTLRVGFSDAQCGFKAIRAGQARLWAAATVSSSSAAPLQFASGEPVMAIGGFNGTDPTPTLAQFEGYVAGHEIHYFVGTNSDSFGGGSGDAAQISAWVKARFTSKTVGRRDRLRPHHPRLVLVMSCPHQFRSGRCVGESGAIQVCRPVGYFPASASRSSSISPNRLTTRVR